MPGKSRTSHKNWWQRLSIPKWLILILALVFLLRIPSFFQPYTYGDEMIYLDMGEAARRGMVLYKDIHDNKPPLLYYTAAVSGNLYVFHAILAFWMLGTIVLFWKLAKALFPKQPLITKASVAIFALLTTIPLLEGQIANAEIFMIGPTIAAFLILLTKKLNAKNVIFAGVLFSISTLFKVPAMFDIGAIVFLWFVALKARKKSVLAFGKQFLFLIIGFATPIILTMAWYYMRGAFHEYFVAAFLQNIGYLSSWRPDQVREPFLTRNAPLLLRGGVVLGGLALLFAFKKKLSSSFIFSTSWLLFALFAATLSERPYPHYLIQVVPAVSLLIGILLAKESIEQSLSIIPLFLLLLAVVKFQFWYYPTTSYYVRFYNYATGQMGRDDYLNSFGKETTRSYEISKYLMSSSGRDDKVFVWGDSPAIYAMSHRLPPIKYVATYHINDFSSHEEVIGQIVKSKPHFIVILPNSPDFPELTRFVNSGYIQVENIEGATIWKSLGISLSSLQN